MSELAVITPSFRGDAEIFADLHRSVLEFTPDDTVHHVFVPESDKPLFSRYEGPRCRIFTSAELMPRRYVRIGKGDSYVNARRPWPPVRGWITQQAIKIAAAGRLDADVVLVADSDVVLVRPVNARRFESGGQRLLYREDNGVNAGMERHLIWHRVARELFGLPAAPPPPLPDYVSSFNFWEPAVVRAMQQRIQETTGRDWLDAFTAQLHISEFMMYGIFVDEVLSAGGPRPAADNAVCHNTWQTTPMGHDEAIAFADRLGPDAVAMMISAKSHTPLDIRRSAIQRCATIVKSG
ncbi:DUF6492 family protein [Rugosimonospora acidiphila]|uniref:DUF6492 family protein n=1 Tax=Rugosimonospora acidiphila TaxID=556531 RepID=A0ABP9SRC3_9ACTN